MPQSIQWDLFQELHGGLLSHSYVRTILSQHGGWEIPVFMSLLQPLKLQWNCWVPLQVIIIPGLQWRLPAASTVTLYSLQRESIKRWFWNSSYQVCVYFFFKDALTPGKGREERLLHGLHANQRETAEGGVLAETNICRRFTEGISGSCKNLHRGWAQAI